MGLSQDLGSGKKCSTYGILYSLWSARVSRHGRSGSPGHFQRVMQQVTAELEDFVIISIDDVLVRNKDNLSMVDYIERFLEALTRHNLKISPSKSKIGAEQITFLVHTISPRGAKPDA